MVFSSYINHYMKRFKPDNTIVYSSNYFYNIIENISISTYKSNPLWVIYLNIQALAILKMSSQVTYNWLRLAQVSEYQENHLFSSKFQAFLGRMLSNWLPATLTQFLGLRSQSELLQKNRHGFSSSFPLSFPSSEQTILIEMADQKLSQKKSQMWWLPFSSLLFDY